MEALRPYKFLVVDDDETHLLAVGAWLRSVGHQVVTLSSPFGTGRAVIQERPDVVLLDLQMPGLSGYQVATLLEGHAAFIKVGVIFYSATADQPADVTTRGLLGTIVKTGSGRTFLRELSRLLQASSRPVDKPA